MYSIDKFEFTENPPRGAGVTVDHTVHDKSSLLRILAVALRFPEYFGQNWDALVDCLSDLSPILSPEVTIDHESISGLGEEDLRMYLKTLVDVLDSRNPKAVPRLRVVFRLKERDAVIAALRGIESSLTRVNRSSTT